MSVPLCGKCRTANTPEHQESAFHKHNVDLASRGIMPVSETMFNTYEKHKNRDYGASAASPSSPSAAAEEPKLTKNQNSWHWEEGDYTPWAEKRLPELLKQAKIPGCVIKKVAKFEGDAYINKRKGRRFAGYEIELQLEWEGTIKDHDDTVLLSVSGKARCPEISPDVDDHQYVIDEITVNGDSEGHEVMRQTMCVDGRKAIRKQIQLWAEELESKVHEHEE